MLLAPVFPVDAEAVAGLRAVPVGIPERGDRRVRPDVPLRAGEGGNVCVNSCARVATPLLTFLTGAGAVVDPEQPAGGGHGLAVSFFAYP